MTAHIYMTDGVQDVCTGDKCPACKRRAPATEPAVIDDTCGRALIVFCPDLECECDEFAPLGDATCDEKGARWQTVYVGTFASRHTFTQKVWACDECAESLRYDNNGPKRFLDLPREITLPCPTIAKRSA